MNPQLTMAVAQAHQGELRRRAQTARPADEMPSRPTLAARVRRTIATLRVTRHQPVPTSTSAAVNS